LLRARTSRCIPIGQRSQKKRINVCATFGGPNRKLSMTTNKIGFSSTMLSFPDRADDRSTVPAASFKIAQNCAIPATVASGSGNTAAIRKLQRILNREKIWSPNLDVDGRFNAATHNAVRGFQYRNGLVDDGVVGPGTWRKLFEKLGC
jgi:peptidoglycan hydrolase-like protein with peptidoglycan-binding domain